MRRQKREATSRKAQSLRVSASPRESLFLFRCALCASFDRLRTRSARIPHRSHAPRSEEHTSELQSLMRISYAVFCLKKKNNHRLYSVYSSKSTSQHIQK